jgi:hypothetical protein
MTREFPAFCRGLKSVGGAISLSHGVPATPEPDEEALPASGTMRALDATHPTRPLTGGEILVGGSRRGLTAATAMGMTTQPK